MQRQVRRVRARSLITVCWMLALTGAVIGCGDDDGGGGSAATVAGNGGSGGMGATGGSSGTGGSGGMGGTAGEAGTGATGGSGGIGATGGSSGTGGSGGIGGTAGEAGTGATGGSGGTGGSSGESGSGGSGGATARCVAPTPRVNPGNACRNSAPPALRLQQVVGSLAYPVSMKFAPGDSSRLFVVERTGSIRIVRNNALVAEPFLTLSGVTSGFNEQGLLDMAFDPDYADNGHFYIFYIRNNDNPLEGLYETAVIRYTVSSNDPDRADPNSASTLFTLARGEANHNGGQLQFGPDGCLFVSLGDGGGSNDQHGIIGNGQDNTQPLGKLLRIDVDNYPTPAPGNLTGNDVYPHIWDTGLRNPWRFSFDRTSGDLYMGDVGQGTWEEVNVEPAGTGKRNYGWRPMEGMHCRGQTDDGGGCDRTGLTLPVAEYRNGVDGNAIVGGYVYRGTAMPTLQGRYFYADYQTDRIWTFTWNGTGICDTYEVTDDLNLNGPTSFGEDADGELYIMVHGNGSNGVLYRIEEDTGV